MAKVQFYYLDRRPSFKEKNKLKLFIEGIFADEKHKLQNLSYIFCSDDHLLKINQDFLKHDFYTDIITFDLSAGKFAPIDGEIYISTDRVKDNARLLNITFKEELHRVIFHGALHLCGYKDKTKNDLKLMRQAEDKYLRQYFI